MKLMLTAVIASLLFTPHKVIIQKWVIEKSSNLYIEGRSNVNSFRCNVTEYLHPDTVVFYKDQHQQDFNIKGALTINVDQFDCHQRYLTGDLRKTLKVTAYPLLKIELLSIGDFTVASNKNIKGIVAITLAGIRKNMEVSYTVEAGKEGNLHFYGSREVLFSDFGLTPPHKLAGLIKVEQEISIRFQLILRSVQINLSDKNYSLNNITQ